MPSSADRPTWTKPVGHRLADGFQLWNRKLHYYVGLYLLFFVWLFALTGLLLNHSSWNFAQFFPNRKVTNWESPIQAPTQSSDLGQAQEIMRQLGIRGEIAWGGPRADPWRLAFNAARPGRNYQVQADLKQGRAKVTLTEFNGWGVVRTLHTFVGVSPDDSRNRRDWILTTVWALSMDAVAAGVLFLVLSGIYMWWVLKDMRVPGLLALVLGMAVCGWFTFGLRWLYG